MKEKFLGSVNNLDWKCFHSLEEAAPFWRKLMEFGNYRVFQDFDFTNAWYQTIGKQKNVDPRIIVSTCDDKPVILFPLGIYQRLGIRRLAWLGSDWNDYNGPVVGDQSLLSSGQDIWTKVFELVGKADILEISKQAPWYGMHTENAVALQESVREDNSTHILDLHSDYQALRKSIYSSRTWQGFERKKRKLKKLGELTFQCETDPSERKRIVEMMLQIKAEDLAARGKKNPFQNCGAANFLPTIAIDCEEISRVYTLRLNGEVLATTFCLVEKNSVLLYQTSYDKNYGFASPGTLLLHFIIFKAAENGFESFDCLFGDEPYKLKICNRSVPVGRVLVPISKLGVALKYFTIGKIVLTRKVKHSPSLYLFARKVNRILSNFGRVR
ncbi:MAG: GNAT family N-acetyltransferase [Rhizobiaceae bacterium]|nr:GNAT family N-acetyltransferase [Rhizobiaceae bacterium]